MNMINNYTIIIFHRLYIPYDLKYDITFQMLSLNTKIEMRDRNYEHEQ